MKNFSVLFKGLKSKVTFLTILIFSFNVSVFKLNAQTPQKAWAKQIGGLTDDYGRAIAVDKTGAIYTTGSFNGVVDFDPGSNIYNLTSTAGSNGDIYVNKLNPQGHLIWAKQFKGNYISNSNIGTAITTNDKGNLYIAGTFTGTVDFDPGPDSFMLTATGGRNAFLAKLSPNGDLIWVKRMAGNTVYSHCIPSSIAVNSHGDVLLTGRFYQTINFNPEGTAANQTSGNNFPNVFITKFTKDGVFSWVKNIGNEGAEESKSIVLDAADNIYTTGFFGYTVDFDPGPGIFNLTGIGIDAFILKLNNDGAFVWAKRIGGFSTEMGRSLATDQMGHVYFAGQYGTNNMQLNPNQATDSVLAKFLDVFLIKLDTAGNFIYGKRFGGAGVENVSSIATDTLGNLFMTGTFTDTTDFSTGNGGGVLASGGLEDAYVAKLNSSGNLQWIKQISGSAIQIPYALALSNTGNIYSIGIFQDTTNFNLNENNDPLNSNGGYDIYIEKIAQCLPTDLVFVSGIAHEQNSDSIHFSANGITNVFYYYWDFGDGTTSYESDPTHVFPQAGNYTVTLIASNDCYADTVSITINYDPTGIKNVISNNGILKMYPNPTQNTLYLQVRNQQLIETISVYNILGQKITAYKDINHSSYTLDTQLLPSGSYMIKLSFKNNTKVVYGRFQKID